MSISSQGLLYSLGVFVGGVGTTGKVIGMILLSLWAFIQPFISYFLMYGTEILSALAYFEKKNWQGFRFREVLSFVCCCFPHWG